MSYRPTCFEQRKPPVKFTFITFCHVSKDISVALEAHPIPTKHTNISMLPRIWMVLLTDSSTPCSLDTSATSSRIFAEGKSTRSPLIKSADLSKLGRRSNIERPCNPCSSKARDAAKPRSPAPPVTRWERNTWVNKAYLRCKMKKHHQSRSL